MSLKFTPIMMAMLLSFSINSLNPSFAKETTEIPNQNLTEKTSATEENRDAEISDLITINDPVATYNGIPISKEEFLDYMEGQTGMRSDEFYDIDSLETALQIYLLQKYKMEQAKDLGIMDQPNNKLEAKFIKQAILTGEVLSQKIISEEDLELEKSKVKKPNRETLEIFASIYYPSVDFGEVENNPELEGVIQDSYKVESVLFSVAESAKLDQDDQFHVVYDSAILNLWSKKYDEFFIEHLAAPTEKELNESFDEWLKSQDFNRYKIAHIYLKDKEQAEKLLKQIKDGEITFEDAAKRYSLDNNSKGHGGKLQQGWWVTFLDPEVPLARVARNIKPGELYAEVIGAINEGYYHIVYLEDVEESTTPEDYLNNEALKKKKWEATMLEENNANIKSHYVININQ